MEGKNSPCRRGSKEQRTTEKGNIVDNVKYPAALSDGDRWCLPRAMCKHETFTRPFTLAHRYMNHGKLVGSSPCLGPHRNGTITPRRDPCASRNRSLWHNSPLPPAGGSLTDRLTGHSVLDSQASCGVHFGRKFRPCYISCLFKISLVRDFSEDEAQGFINFLDQVI